MQQRLGDAGLRQNAIQPGLGGQSFAARASSRPCTAKTGTVTTGFNMVKGSNDSWR